MIRPALMAAALSLPLGALPLPMAATAHAADARLASRLYNKDEVVRIDGRVGVQATIAFSEDEHIENVAIGDAESWQVTPNKRANLLFVKPLAPRARTNLTVVTESRTYFFDLVAGGPGAPLYVLRFRYPEAAKPMPLPAGGTALTAEEQQAASATPAEKPVDPATLNFAWRAKGEAKLLPTRIYDDGEATYLTWAAGRPMPAILIRNEKGDEGPVNFASRGDVIVVDGVHPLIVLRSGRDMATLENRGGAPRLAAAAPVPPKPNPEP
jgi:type IV secretion system protein VirB9